jgi:hypothetical protein
MAIATILALVETIELIGQKTDGSEDNIDLDMIQFAV